MEVGAGNESGLGFEDRSYQLLGGSRIRRGLQDHDRTNPEMPPEHPCGLLDVRQVGYALAERRRDIDHRDVEAAELVLVARRSVATRGQRVGDLLGSHVGHEGLAVGQRLDPCLVEVEPDDVVADLDRPHGHRQPHIALTEDGHLPWALCVSAMSDEVGKAVRHRPCVPQGSSRCGAASAEL